MSKWPQARFLPVFVKAGRGEHLQQGASSTVTSSWPQPLARCMPLFFCGCRLQLRLRLAGRDVFRTFGTIAIAEGDTGRTDRLRVSSGPACATVPRPSYGTVTAVAPPGALAVVSGRGTGPYQPQQGTRASQRFLDYFFIVLSPAAGFQRVRPLVMILMLPCSLAVRQPQPLARYGSPPINLSKLLQGLGGVSGCII